MKNLQTFEEFLNEATKNDNVITFRKFKDIDHTRLVKWMFTEFGNKYNPGMKWIDGHLIKGGDFELDVTNWEKRDLAVLKAYLKSQSYITEGLVNESSRVRFNHNKYYIVFDWYIQGQISPTAIGKEFSTEDEAEKNIDGWKNELSMRMSRNATRLEARNTLDSFIVLDGGQLNDANKYEFYVSLD